MTDSAQPRADIRPGSTLVIDDARADRARFRLLLDQANVSHYHFAWKWLPRQGGSVLGWFESLVEEFRGPAGDPPASFHEWLCALSPAAGERLFERLGQFGLVFLDLAWTGAAESVMQTGLSLDRQQGANLAKKKGYAIQDSGLLRFTPPGWPDELPDDARPSLVEAEGVALLEWLSRSPARQSHSGVFAPRICITSAYVPDSSDGLRVFLRDRYRGLGIDIVHKWIAENSIRERLIVR